MILEKIYDYDRLWNRQFLHEFRLICYQHALSLDPPVFAISNSKKQLGNWRPGIRQITISRNLILHYPWDVTLKILKHEMAHQICTEIFDDQNGGHGENFNRACDLLGLPERFRHSGGDLPFEVERLERDDDQDSKVIEKIRKLLALAESSNEHESVLAMEMAGRLLKRYNIRQIDEDERHNYVYLIINMQRKRIDEYQHRIILILKRFFYVEALSSSLYDPLRDETHKTFEILGKKENVEIAEYCYHFLEKKLSALWRQKSVSFNGNKRIAKKSYYLGLLQGFNNKLAEQEISGRKSADNPLQSQPFTNSELIVAADSSLQRFLHTRYPRISRRSIAGAKIYRETYDQGLIIGRTLVIHRGIAGAAGNNGKLLEQAKLQ
jgi:hypothetical protein